MAITKEVKIALGMCLTAKDMRELNVDIDCLNDIQDFLYDYFFRIGQLATPQFYPNVSWDHLPGDISDTDLVVYFVRDPASGIIKNLGLTISPDGGGLTALGAKNAVIPAANAPKALVSVMQSAHGAISEVYVENNFPSAKLAKIALHELMHNKLQLDNNQLHNLTPNVSVGKNHVSATTLVSSGDITRMAAAMGNPVKQYTERLKGSVPALFATPASTTLSVVTLDADGNAVTGYLSPSQRAAARGKVDWSRAVRRAK